MGLIRRNFVALDAEVLKALFKAVIRPHRGYANLEWNPHLNSNIEMVEKVQSGATRMVSELRELNYEEWLRRLKLRTNTILQMGKGGYNRNIQDFYWKT